MKRSLVAAAGGLFRLPNKIPHHIAMEMILTGDRTSLCNGLYVWRGDHLCVRVHVRVMGLLGRVLYDTQHSPNLMLLLLLLPLLRLLSGISAARAHHFGMVNHLCEPGKALEAALELAARITVRLIVKGVLSKRDIKEK